MITFDQEKEKDQSFKVVLVSADSEGAKIGRLKKTIITVVDDDGEKYSS